jgi:hypothetical protein
MSPTAEARADLAATLEPVWPGRVRPYLPAMPRPNAGIYIGGITAGWSDDFTWAATFSVRIVADGADHAAQAMLDDLLDQVYRAVARSSHFYPDAAVWEPFDVDAAVSLPAYTFDVRAELDTATWCDADAPVAVTLPPVPIGA